MAVLDKNIKVLMLKGEKGDPGVPAGSEWGQIIGDIDDQEDLTVRFSAKANVSHQHLANDITNLFNAVYPVGSIYMSVSNTSPATLFGGTWERLKDRFLLGAGDTFAAGTTGGERNHTLTVNELPAIKYSNATWGNTFSASEGEGIGGVPYSASPNAATISTGGGAAHNNMPPYLAVYMWKRTA